MDSPHEVGQLVHFPGCCRVRAVQGKAGRQHGHHAARTGQFQGLEDELVMDQVSPGVSSRVSSKIWKTPCAPQLPHRARAAFQRPWRAGSRSAAFGVPRGLQGSP